MLLLNLFLFVLGLVFGSFVTALSWRYPRKISNIKGRSFCDNCKKEIVWYDNIPLLSFLILGGKCRNCEEKISIRYPLIELSTAIGFVTIGYLQGPSLQAVYSIVILLILEAIFVIDFENQIIPDDFIFFGLFVVFLYTIYYIPYTLMPSALAGFVAASLLLIVHLLTKGRGMGLGDVKFAILGGILTGLNLFLIWLFVAFLTGAVVGIILILVKKAGIKSKIAFGPFLVISIGLTYLFGNTLMRFLGF